MVILNMLISVYHAEPDFSMIGFPIHLIASYYCLIGLLMCMYSLMEYCFKSHLKMISNGLHETKKLLDLHH